MRSIAEFYRRNLANEVIKGLGYYGCTMPFSAR